MFRRAVFMVLALSMCLTLFPTGAENDWGIWIDRHTIRYGESFKLYWKLDPGDGGQDFPYVLNTFEDNNRQEETEYQRIYNAPYQGVKEITPTTGGNIYLWFHYGDGYTTFCLRVEGGPDEGNFRSAITLDKASAMPGDTVTAKVTLTDGRRPMGQTRIVWRVLDAWGELREVHWDIGLTSTLTVPRGIQGVVEAHTTDSAGRTALARKYFGIGPGEPLRVSMPQLNKTSVIQGQPITARWSITGGDPPYTAEPYWGLTASSDGFNWSMLNVENDGATSSTFYPEDAGYASVQVTVRDARGREVQTDKKTFIATDWSGKKTPPTFYAEDIVPPSVAREIEGRGASGPAGGRKGSVPAKLNQDMSTRSGPGGKYTEELGTLPMKTPIRLIETVTTATATWGLVEFTLSGWTYRAYTGMQRIDTSSTVPESTLRFQYEARLSRATTARYGPGDDYAKRKDTVPAGTMLQVFGTENGFYVCEYPLGKETVRAYFPTL